MLAVFETRTATQGSGMQRVSLQLQMECKKWPEPLECKYLGTFLPDLISPIFLRAKKSKEHTYFSTSQTNALGHLEL